MKRTFLLTGLCVSLFTSYAQLQPPVLLTPADSANKVRTNIELDWQPSLGGVVSGYEVQVDLSSNFSAPVIKTVPASAALYTELMFDSTYYWRVRANGTSGNSDWSDTLQFTVYGNDFVLVGPPDTDTVSVVSAQLLWKEIEPTINYHFQIDTTPSFNSSVLYTGSLINPTPDATQNEITAVREGLLFDQVYYWRMRAYHSKDISSWSNVWSFTTPATLTQNTVDNGVEGIAPDSSISVISMSGVEEYEFEIDTSAALSPGSGEYELERQAGAVYEFSDLLFGVTYHWRARGINNADMSEWTKVWSFTVANTVLQLSPADSATTDQDPVLQWEKLKGVPFYQIEFDDNPSFTNQLILASDPDASEFTFPESLGAGTYYWRIRGILASTRDTSSWSPTRIFTVEPVGIGELSSGPAVHMFPNPVSRALNLTLENLEGKQLTLRIVDLTGREVLNRNLAVRGGLYKEAIDFGEMTNGIYMVFVSGEGYHYSQKITVSK